MNLCVSLTSPFSFRPLLPNREDELKFIGLFVFEQGLPAEAISWSYSLELQLESIDILSESTSREFSLGLSLITWVSADCGFLM